MKNDIGEYETTSEVARDLKVIGQIYRKDMGEVYSSYLMRTESFFRSCMKINLRTLSIG